MWGQFGHGLVSLPLELMKNTLLMSLHQHECSMLMLHQCIVAPLMQEILSFDSDMGLFLNCISAYEDLEDLVTILDLAGLLLHRLCFAHIYKSLGNQYFLLFAFALLVFLLLCFGYTRDFGTEVLPLCQIFTYSFSMVNCFQHSLW